MLIETVYGDGIGDRLDPLEIEWPTGTMMVPEGTSVQEDANGAVVWIGFPLTVSDKQRALIGCSICIAMLASVASIYIGCLPPGLRWVSAGPPVLMMVMALFAGFSACFFDQAAVRFFQKDATPFSISDNKTSYTTVIRNIRHPNISTSQTFLSSSLATS